VNAPRPTFSCMGKEQYASRALAEKVRRRRARARDKRVLDSYRCKACGFWHLGASSKGLNR